MIGLLVLVFSSVATMASTPADIDVLGHEGAALFEAGNHHGALNRFEQIIELDPKNVEAHIWKADSLGMLGKHEQSMQSYTDAIALDPKSKRAHYNRAIMATDMHQYQLALKDYQTALDIDPTNQHVISNDKIHQNMGIIYGLQDNLDQAIISFGLAIMINQQYSEAFFNRGLALEKQGNLAGAKWNYEQAIKLEPGNPEYLMSVRRVTQ